MYIACLPHRRHRGIKGGNVLVLPKEERFPPLAPPAGGGGSREFVPTPGELHLIQGWGDKQTIAGVGRYLDYAALNELSGQDFARQQVLQLALNYAL